VEPLAVPPDRKSLQCSAVSYPALDRTKGNPNLEEAASDELLARR